MNEPYDQSRHRFKEVTIVAKLRMRRITEARDLYRVLHMSLKEAIDSHGGEEVIDFFCETSRGGAESLEAILEAARESLRHGTAKYPRTEIVGSPLPGTENSGE